MSKEFITPKLEELAEAGLLEESDSLLAAEISEVAQQQDSAQTDPNVIGLQATASFKARWKATLAMPAEDVLALVEREYADQPQQAREVLALFVAQKLGYRRLFHYAHTPGFTEKPLWDVLEARKFGKLSAVGVQALLRIARSTHPGRPALHPMAALAAIALWWHADAEHQQAAEALLRGRSLPDEPDWLYKLTGTLVDAPPPANVNEVDQLSEIDELNESSEIDELNESSEVSTGGEIHEVDAPASLRTLYALAELQCDAQFWDATVFLSAMHLVRQLAPARVGSPAANLLKVCDRAADEKPAAMRPWLQLMARATVGGQLNYAWLEKPMRAAIRLSIDEPEVEARLRDWHERYPYDADHQRLQQLYEADLDAMAHADADARDRARRRLLNAVERTQKFHPTRAQRLLELMVMREHPRRSPNFAARLSHALQQVAQKPALSDLDRALIRLYVANYHIEPGALQLVRTNMERIDWDEAGHAAGRDALQMYLIISDYERAFAQLTCKFDGVELEHADKDAAARVKHFVEKRLDPNHLTRLVRTLFLPIEWLGASLGHLEVVSKVVERALGLLDERVRASDLSARVLADYRAAGIELDSLDDLARLNMGQVERVLRKRRTMRLMLSAVAGGLSGGLSPFGGPALSLADAPILLALSADICSRFCWYYGFDPRQHPELPMEILAVALGGSRAEAIEPMLLRQNLSQYAIRKSLMVGALAHGGVTQMGARTLGRMLQEQLGAQAAQKFSELARRALTTNLQRRAAEAVPSRTLPLVGAALGATLNVALIYDVCEAAQAVLTDRFLERKYPDWIRKFDPEVHASPDISMD